MAARSNWPPFGTGSAVVLTDAGTLAINGGASIILTKGSETSLTFTVGNSGTVFTSANDGTLVITPTASSDLGSATGFEDLKSLGTAPTTTNNALLVNIPVVIQASQRWRSRRDRG